MITPAFDKTLVISFLIIEPAELTNVPTRHYFPSSLRRRSRSPLISSCSSPIAYLSLRHLRDAEVNGGLQKSSITQRRSSLMRIILVIFLVHAWFLCKYALLHHPGRKHEHIDASLFNKMHFPVDNVGIHLALLEGLILVWDENINAWALITLAFFCFDM